MLIFPGAAMVNPGITPEDYNKKVSFKATGYVFIYGGFTGKKLIIIKILRLSGEKSKKKYRQTAKTS
jgi:hypothetical protein